MSSLATLEVGHAGPRVAFLHGLFGQGRNWNQVAKGVAGPLGDQARCLLVDLPDHGRSRWSEEFSYAAYAQAVGRVLEGVDPARWIVVGHSMGGKVAMTLALTRPEVVAGLVVVDIAPKDYGSLDRFTGYINAMRTLPLDQVARRDDADRIFATVESSPQVRAFLLQNLRREGDSWRWQANLDLVHQDAKRGASSRIAGFPFHPADGVGYDGPVLWLAGGESAYILPGDHATMRAYFPRVRTVTVKGASHWVHTDSPEVVIEAIRRFVARAAPQG